MYSELMRQTLKRGYFFDRNSRYKKTIVGIIKDGTEPICVYKWYGRHKQWWHYECETVEVMEYYLQQGIYTPTKVKTVKIVEKEATIPDIAPKDDGVAVYTAKGNVYTAKWE